MNILNNANLHILIIIILHNLILKMFAIINVISQLGKYGDIY